MNKLLLATHNIGKKKEIELFLSDLNLEILSLRDLNINKDVVEKDESFLSNSLLKSKEYHKLSGEITLAEDSGLEVKALDGRPGVLSARYGGENLNDSDRNDLLLSEMKDVKGLERSARFVSVVTLVSNNNEVSSSYGYLNGYITHQKIGIRGFGYDPIFWVPKKSNTTANLSMKQKNEISHRGKALEGIKPALKRLYKIV